MRYIPISKIEPDMVLASPFYGPNFEVMLGDGMTLSKSHITRIADLGYQGIYIHDELSSGLIPIDVIHPDLRISTIKMCKEILTACEKGGIQGGRMSQATQARLIQPLVDAVISSQTRLFDSIDLKPFDDYSYYHTANVIILSLLVGLDLGAPTNKLVELGMAALLHDVGNMFIPKSILNKPGTLTPEEFEIVKTHSQMGFDFLRENFDISIEACMGTLQHHENYDGTGYPNNLKKDKISIYGRIIAVTDVFDALTSRRPYRDPVYPVSAMDYMEARCETLFDPKVVASLKNVVSMYPMGCFVELDDGREGIVVENFGSDTSRPRVRVINNGIPSDVVNLHEMPNPNLLSVAQIIEK